MELKDLKSAWDTYSSQEMAKHQLGKETINELLKNRTSSMLDRIDRNIWIGLAVLIIFIVYVLYGDLYFSEMLTKEPIDYPSWLNFLDNFTCTLIVTTYLFFVLRYLRIKRSFSVDNQLKDLLIGIVNTLKTYRTMFYMAVIILMIDLGLSFLTPIYRGIKLSTGTVSSGISTLTTTKILTIIGVGLTILIILIALTFLILRWGFNRLYGRYLVKLNETLTELDEPVNAE
jgi:hypothetical protein